MLVFLAVQRRVVLVLGHQDLGQQARGRGALVDDVRQHGGLHQGVALGADPLAADLALDREAPGTQSSFSVTSSPARNYRQPHLQAVFSGSCWYSLRDRRGSRSSPVVRAERVEVGDHGT